MRMIIFLFILAGVGFAQERLSSPQPILITGVAGFIGFHTAREANRRGYQVVGFDHFNDYYDPALKMRRAELLKKEGIEVLTADLCDFERIREIFEARDWVGVIHLAGQAGVRASVDSPQTYIESNIVGSWFLFELNRKKKIPIVLASSSSVYGDQDSGSFSEFDRTDEPLSLYAATKKSVEMIAHSYHAVHGMPITCLRFFSVYGPWGRPDMAYYSFARNIAKGVPITVYGQGALLRDMTYVDDVVQGIFLSLEQCSGYRIYNLGCSEPRSVAELIFELERSLGIPARQIYAEKPNADALRTHADISKSEAELGYHPTVSLREGIERFVAWFREYEPEVFR